MSNPKSKLIPRIGRMQLLIMQVLWRLKAATARQITDELAALLPASGAPARSTVQTLLRQLEAKRLVEHSVGEERGQFFFRPLVAEGSVAESTASDLLDRMFQGSISRLVAHLLTSERVSADEMSRLQELIDAQRAQINMDDGENAGSATEDSPQ